MSKDLEELEAELLGKDDIYVEGLKEKVDNRLLVNNFLESNE